MRKAVIYLKSKLQNTDYILLCAVCLLSVYGLLVIHGTVGGASEEFFTQCIGFAIGVPLMLVTAFTNWQKLFYGCTAEIRGKRIAVFPTVVFAVYALLLAFTLKYGVGAGNRSWLILPFYPYHFQPSELIKPLFMLTVSAHIEAVKAKLNRPLSLLGLAIHGGIAVSLVALQGDLGTALVFGFMFAFMLALAGVKLRWFASVLSIAAILSPIMWKTLKGYRRMRIIYGFRPDLDPTGYGYQALMSRRTIIEAGFFGAGQGNADLSSIPAVETDMIFASLTAQFGWTGAAVCIALITIIVCRILYIGIRAEKQRKTAAPKMICAGAAAVIIIQSAESIGMCFGVIPIVGITLPLISCGGSSLVSTLVMLGMVLGISGDSNAVSAENSEKSLCNEHH